MLKVDVHMSNVVFEARKQTAQTGINPHDSSSLNTNYSDYDSYEFIVF